MSIASIFLPLALLVGVPPTTYPALKSAIEVRRIAFQRSYAQADSAARPAVIDSAQAYLFDRITLDLLPAWYGTPWDFNGTTRTPRQGTIACGYFVNTVMQDAGFRLPRIAWSQRDAEGIVRALSGRAERFRDRPVAEVAAYLDGQGDGLYAVGLDHHVGFLVRRNGVSRFVHSNYYRPGEGVMSEPLAGDNPLAHSRYRIVGTLLTEELMRAWIAGTDLAGRERP